MIFSFFGMRGLTRAQASTGWPSAPGKVIKSSVEREESSYEAQILYEFTLAGTTYNGNRVAYGDYGSDRPTHARRIVNLTDWVAASGRPRYPGYLPYYVLARHIPLRISQPGWEP